jgi:hypothetical protein
MEGRMSEPRATYQSTSTRPLKSYDDFIFWNRATLQVLEVESMPTVDGPAYARKLAQKYGVTVAYAIVQEYFVEPTKCPTCGTILPETGPCWNCLFPEEEAPTNSIPFRGEPMPNREIDTKSYYGL